MHTLEHPCVLFAMVGNLSICLQCTRHPPENEFGEVVESVRLVKRGEHSNTDADIEVDFDVDGSATHMLLVFPKAFPTRFLEPFQQRSGGRVIIERSKAEDIKLSPFMARCSKETEQKIDQFDRLTGSRSSQFSRELERSMDEDVVKESEYRKKEKTRKIASSPNWRVRV